MSNDTKTKFSDELYLKIIKTYLDTESVKETAKLLNISVVKVRKVLITEELWSSKTSLEVQHYLYLGKTTSEIAEILCTTEKAVQQYLPYTKGIYKGDSLSSGALNTAEYRERIRNVKSKILKQNKNIAQANKWDEMLEKSSSDIESSENTEFDKEEMSYLIEPIRLHLELVLPRSEKVSEAEDKVYLDIIDTLHRYGDVNYGDTISRDIIVPFDMPLWALNYAIQKCFGWQNSHLHCFELSDITMRNICDNDSKKFMKLTGVVFRSLWMDIEEEFWTDDYENGSFNTWLRKKYTGPYESLCHGEGLWQCKQDIKELKKRFKYASVEREVFESGNVFYHGPRAISKKEYEELKVNPIIEKKEAFNGNEETVFIEGYTFDELPLDSLSWISESGINRVLERLRIMEVMLMHEDIKVPSCYSDVINAHIADDIKVFQRIDHPYAQPRLDGITDELYYCYDYGDGWKVRITASIGANDLIECGRITRSELEIATIKMFDTWRPVCIAHDGVNVLDDVGGVHGLVQFLRGINQKKSNSNEPVDWSEEYGNYGDKEASLLWAKGQGWSKRKISNKSLL